MVHPAGMPRRPSCRAAARVTTVFAAVWFGWAAAPARGAAETGPAEALPAAVNAALARAEVPRDSFVAVVQEVGSSRPKMAWRIDQPVAPASLMKLLTTCAALDLLGPAWTWSTPVWLQGKVHDGVLDGNLVIKGSGDPKLVLERLWLLLRRVQQLGVREIRGDIVLDRSVFALPEQSPADFDGEPLRPYNVLADALLINFKAITFSFTPDPARGVALVTADPPLGGMRVDTGVPLAAGPCADWRAALHADFSDATHVQFTGDYAAACGEQAWSVAYADPTSFNHRAVAGLWQELGGRLTGSVHDGAAPPTRPSFEAVSPTLAELVRDINKYSNNVMAQQLFLTLGMTLGMPPGVTSGVTQRDSGTPEAARRVLAGWARQRFGSAADALVVDNGSGLSRTARVSAHLLARLLQSAWASPVMPELMSSLPVTGVDGTLRHAKAPAGRAHLKTGTLRDVAGIAGYVLADSGRRYVVVAIVNHPNAGAARPALDALVQWAAADRTRATPALDASR